ncbi:hypothetical protein DICPUDRAFT_98222 [Dictyostelium purpureum]|uniref:ParB/Sulfiredoxin domain-containing protein n=1 Tax=Dictyostelium purpureum TaxID=5786 RepID=F0ZNN2_DICPU|nr:uncharacterized protein DICPUDRAFT_98222 [Dictyostelium purpureum]EGC34440.1 hypothetical protein DICPUDRAFT_98222 [Dictyostelium purpureum]|eukprot:XP_003289025.1 hypothetical protein DICPUDRAFT_98222 [Dictyostelium purpureum]
MSYMLIEKLRPTQCAVGMNHVLRKVGELQELKSSQGIQKVSEFLKTHPAPVVIKNNEVFLIDNHHLCRALHELGDDFFKDIPLEENIFSNKPIMYINVVSDLSHLSDQTEFWNKMNQEKWVHPYNKHGEGPVNVNEIPQSVGLLEDDIFRSIAAVVKIKGGFKKTFIPYAEFQWANYFRSCYKNKEIDPKTDFEKLIAESLELSKSDNAKHLPGFIQE